MLTRIPRREKQEGALSFTFQLVAAYRGIHGKRHILVPVDIIAERKPRSPSPSTINSSQIPPITPDRGPVAIFSGRLHGEF
jgi:hypothetical protein